MRSRSFNFCRSINCLWLKGQTPLTYEAASSIIRVLNALCMTDVIGRLTQSSCAITIEIQGYSCVQSRRKRPPRPAGV